MKLYITFIILILGVLPAYAEQYSSGGEKFFVGVLQGLFFMFVFWIWRLFKGNNSKSGETPQKDNTPLNIPSSKPILSPWEEYKLHNSEVAKVIERISNTDMQLLSEESILEKESTLKRMATRFNCSISELKGVVVNTFITRFSSEELRGVIVKLTEKSKTESQKYGIAEENSMSYYIQFWLTEYLQAN